MPHANSCPCLLVCIGSFCQKFMKPEWVPSFICPERPIQNALKATDFRVLILDLAKFMLYKTTPSVVQNNSFCCERKKESV